MFTAYYNIFLPRVRISISLFNFFIINNIVQVFSPSIPNSAKSRIAAMKPFLKGIIEVRRERREEKSRRER